MPGEQLLYQIWEREPLRGGAIVTTCGRYLEILRTGTRNPDAGPDFFNARIRLDRIVWAGNVEIHQLASDWFRHGHHKDPAYDNVILHVVRRPDVEVHNSRGRRIPAYVPRIPDQFFPCLWNSAESQSPSPGRRCIRRVDPDHLTERLSIIQAARLQQKTGPIARLLLRTGFNLEESLYLAMGSGFGLPVNALPFGMVTSTIPFELLLEHRDSIPDLEAILFGHAGLLDEPSARGPYVRKLKQRYRAISRNLRTGPVPPHLWKFLRLRPASFPTLRLSQFASLIQLRTPLLGSFLDFSSATELEQRLRVEASPYWKTHYVFGKSSPPLDKFLGRQFTHNLIINVIVPFMNAIEQSGRGSVFTYGPREILRSLQAESNQIIEKWSKFGITPRNALESQALIQLFKHHCARWDCLDCPVGQDLRSI